MHAVSFSAADQQLDLIELSFHFPSMKWKWHHFSGKKLIISHREHSFFICPRCLVCQWSSFVFLTTPFEYYNLCFICCRITIYQLKTAHVYYLTQFLCVRKLGVAKPGGYGSESLPSLQSRCQLKLTIIWEHDWFWKIDSKVSHLHVYWQEASVPC